MYELVHRMKGTVSEPVKQDRLDPAVPQVSECSLYANHGVILIRNSFGEVE
jgi:hypothetical protein